MSEPSTEPLAALFERWRARGDLAALGAVFDRTARDLLALAAHLVRDPVEAEDLVQATFVAAIEGAATYDRARRLEAWLAGILVKKALRTMRERARRPDPARIDARAADPARAAEERELAERLQRALAQLDEPYRSVLAAYLAGEKPHAIARATERAPGTVRMQLLRGLERLRRLLPQGLLALVPVRVPRGLAALRAEVLASGSGAVCVPAAPLLGGAAKLALVAAAAAIALGLSLIDGTARSSTRSPARAEPDVAGTPASAGASLADFVRPAEERAPVPTASDPAPAPAAPAAQAAAFPVPEGRTGFFVVGELRGIEDVDPSEVVVSAGLFQGGRVAGQAGADGRYALDVTRLLEVGTPAALFVGAEHPDGRRAEVEAPLADSVRTASAYERTEIRVDLELVRRTLVWGRVVTEEQAGSGIVSVALLERDPLGALRPIGSTICDDDGWFRLAARSGGEHVLVARSQGLPAVSRALRLTEGAATDAGEIALVGGAVAIEGVVRPGLDLRSAFLRVRAERVGRGGGIWDGVELDPPTFATVEEIAGVRDDGSFRLCGLAPGEYELALESSVGRLVLPTAGERVTAPQSGVVLGEGLGRARVVLRSEGAARARPSLAASGGGSAVETRVEWGVPADVLADRRVEVVLLARAPGFEEVRHVLPAGRAAEVEIELLLPAGDPLATLELDWILAPELEPPRAVVAEWRALDGSGARTTLSADLSGGRCRFRDRPPGRYALRVEARGAAGGPFASWLRAPELEVELLPGRTTRAAIEWTAGGRVRLQPTGRRPGGLGARVRDAAGNDVAVRFVQRRLDANGGSVTSNLVGGLPEGACELEPNLAPGRYELVLSEGDVVRQRVPFTIVAGELVDVPFELR